MKKIRKFNCSNATVDGICNLKKGGDLPIFLISSYHTLIQFIGYAKYLNRSKGNVYLRGQQQLFNTLIPSIYRKISNPGSFSNRNQHLSLFIEECAHKMSLIRDLDNLIREPILQHYGIGTRWIDVVDNLWVAIWFGIHDWHTKILTREYKNITLRSGGPNEYMYLLLVCSDGINEDKNIPGLYRRNNTYTVDLRKAAPSIFLRPHAQHALLMRAKHLEIIEDSDLSNNIVGIIKLKVDDCVNWIGTNGLCSAKNLFPPVNFDQGYGILIEQTPHEKHFVKDFGSIYSVTY